MLGGSKDTLFSFKVGPDQKAWSSLPKLPKKQWPITGNKIKNLKIGITVSGETFLLYW